MNAEPITLLIAVELIGKVLQEYFGMYLKCWIICLIIVSLLNRVCTYSWRGDGDDMLIICIEY